MAAMLVFRPPSLALLGVPFIPSPRPYSTNAAVLLYTGYWNTGKGCTWDGARILSPSALTCRSLIAIFLSSSCRGHQAEA